MAVFGLALSLLALLVPASARSTTVRATALRAVGVRATPAQRATADAGLARALARATRHSRSATGILVVDLTAKRALWGLRPDLRLLPASTEKLYTTATALALLGPGAQLHTSVLAKGALDADGHLRGNLYLRGGGDPTFGGSRFDRKYYGRGATAERLAAAVAAAGVRSVSGGVIGDESAFDTLRGTPDSGYRLSSDVEGQLSALSYDRGYDPSTARFQTDPPAFAAAKLASALRRAHVEINAGGRGGITPGSARELASVGSPSVRTLIHMTNLPSDNFFAETLLKDIALASGDPVATTPGGAVAVSAYVAKLGIRASIHDGSGLSRRDRTTAGELVRVLTAKQHDPDFTGSLAVVGRSGTVARRLHATAAQDNCLAKTGSLRDVSNLAGYCTAADGHTLAFAMLMNHTYAHLAQPVQDRVLRAIVRYAG